MQRGVFTLARSAGVPIVPVAFSARPCIRFGSRDRVLLPLPFARVVCRYGELYTPPAPGADGALEGQRREVEAELSRMTDELDAQIGLAGG